MRPPIGRAVSSVPSISKEVLAIGNSIAWPRHSLGKGLDQFRETLQKVATDVGAFTEFSEHFPKIDQAIAKYVTS